MKGICEKKFLQQAALLCEKISGNNPTLPILNAVLISASKNKLIFTSTNLEIALSVSIPAQIKKEGKVAIPSKLFSGFISSLSTNEKIEFIGVNNNLIVATPNSSTTLKGYPVSDFPDLPKIKENKSFTVSVSDFVLGLKSVYYSTSLSEMKPEINSVFVSSLKKNPLTFVSTDSFRLAEKTLPYSFSDFVSFLLPHKVVVECIRVFENQEGDLKIKPHENNIVLESKNIKFVSRLVDGSFPNYKEIIPSGFTNTVNIEKRRFSDALKTAMMFCGKLNEMKIKIYSGENFIEFQTNNSDLGEHVVKIPSKMDGDDLSIVFNYRYLSDCLTSINSDSISLKFAGDGKALIVTGFDDNSFRYLVMPMKNL